MRPLCQKERSLLKHLMKMAGMLPPSERWVDEVVVKDLDDGGMGSYVIVEPPRCGIPRLRSDAEFTDSDGTKVLASLYVDSNDVPCEVGMWKVDFSPLVSLPDFANDDTGDT